MSNTRGRTSGAIPTPVSRMRTTASSDCWSAVNQICPPRGVNFTALFRIFAKTCTSRVASPLTRTEAARQIHVQFVLGGPRERHDRFDGRRHQAARRVGLPAQVDLVGGDAGDIEEVVDKSHELSDLALNDLMRARRHGRRRTGLETFQRKANRRERVPELVRQRRQELVLPLIRLLQLGRPFLDAELQVAIQRRRPGSWQSGGSRPDPGSRSATAGTIRSSGESATWYVIVATVKTPTSSPIVTYVLDRPRWRDAWQEGDRSEGGR